MVRAFFLTKDLIHQRAHQRKAQCAETLEAKFAAWMILAITAARPSCGGSHTWRVPTLLRRWERPGKLGAASSAPTGASLVAFLLGSVLAAS